MDEYGATAGCSRVSARVLVSDIALVLVLALALGWGSGMHLRLASTGITCQADPGSSGMLLELELVLGLLARQIRVVWVCC